MAEVAPDAPVISVPTGDEAIRASIYRPGEPPERDEPLRLGPGPHLFVDDFLIEASTGLTRRVNCPQRDPAIPNPIITGPEDRNFQPYISVLRDPESGRFRTWFGTWTDAQDTAVAHVGYMESQDGVHWIRPVRILDDPAPIQFGNSVIDAGPDCPDPSRRYALAWWKDGGLKVATSPDGLTWTPLVPYPVLRHNHDINNIFRVRSDSDGPPRDRYVATISVYTTGPTWSGQRRATMQSVSDDLLHWEQPWYVLTPVDGEDEGETQFYAMDGHLIRGDLWLGLVKVLRDDLRATGTPEGSYGIGYTTLAWTRDGEHWVRDREPFFQPDPREGAWDHAHAWMDRQLVVGDEVFIYYCGYRNGHKVNRFEERQIGLVRMARDRYVSRDADHEPGVLRTPPLLLSAGPLTVNAEVTGELRVRVLDAAGQPLPGLDFDDCLPVRGDSLAHEVGWADGAALPTRVPVRLEFRVRSGRLYGFGL